MTDLCGAKVLILDHGYIELVESWGSDERIIESARMSTQKGFEGWGRSAHYVVKLRGAGRDCWLDCEHNVIARNEDPITPMSTTFYEESAGRFDSKERAERAADLFMLRYAATSMSVLLVPGCVGDEALLGRLWRLGHTTPFEMAGATFEVQAPIAVFREWQRHRTQSYSEASARYAPLPEWDYLPSLERLMMVNGGDGNRQAQGIKGAPTLTEENALEWQRRQRALYAACEEQYQWSLSVGVAKEIARLALTVGRYSKMRASANLRNWLHFLSLRDEKNAQWEIRQYAGEGVRAMLAEKFPRTLSLYAEGRGAT